MAVEIERKFLVQNDSWRALSTASFAIRDGLVATEGGRKVRVRIKGDRASIAIKGPRNGASRAEFEFDLPMAEARELLDKHCDGRVVAKTRYIVPYEGFAWEIDEYGGLLAGIVIAEVELPAMEAEFNRPDWLGVEVTNDERYRKSHLQRMRQREGAT